MSADDPNYPNYQPPIPHRTWRWAIAVMAVLGLIAIGFAVALGVVAVVNAASSQTAVENQQEVIDIIRENGERRDEQQACGYRLQGQTWSDLRNWLSAADNGTPEDEAAALAQLNKTIDTYQDIDAACFTEPPVPPTTEEPR